MPRQPALTGQRWSKDAAIGNNTVVSGTSRDARGFFIFPDRSGLTHLMGSVFELQIVRRDIPSKALKRGIHTMSKRKSDKPSQKTEQTGSPSKKLHFMAESRYLASEERVREFARKYPGEYVISLMPPMAPKPKKKGE